MKLIVEMEMPTGCANCPMADDDSRFCKAAKKYIPMLCKPSWCPICGELPEQHGDLIDRDVSIQTFKCIEEAPYSGFDGQELFYAPEDVVNTLLCQDVVIAAERKDDGK